MVWLRECSILYGAFIVLTQWIDGGSRSANDPGLDGSNLVNRGDIVFVSIEYRQGSLGFLKQDNASISGNQGLKDIIMALQFVQSSIGAFGGDAAQVTVRLLKPVHLYLS